MTPDRDRNLPIRNVSRKLIQGQILCALLLALFFLFVQLKALVNRSIVCCESFTECMLY